MSAAPIVVTPQSKIKYDHTPAGVYKQIYFRHKTYEAKRSLCAAPRCLYERAKIKVSSGTQDIFTPTERATLGCAGRPKPPLNDLVGAATQR